MQPNQKLVGVQVILHILGGNIKEMNFEPLAKFVYLFRPFLPLCTLKLFDILQRTL